MSTACTSLLDLPQSILEDIVTLIRRTILYDGYLCELRLVNSTSSTVKVSCCNADLCSASFNEALLYCLNFRDTPRCFFPSHYMSCPFASCMRPSCANVGVCNHIYARYRLQAQIHLRKETDRRLAEYHDALAEALGLFREHLRCQADSFSFARSQIENTNIFRCTSLNSVLADRLSIFLCEATVTLLEIVDPRQHGALLPKNYLCSRGSWFWLRNLASFLGDIELFNFYCFDANSGNAALTGIQKELPELFATAAARGHEALFQHILCRMPLPQSTNLRYALQGAYYSGNVRITNMILQACSVETVATLCSKSLCGHHGSLRLPLSYSAVAEQVVNKCGDIPAKMFRMILWTQAELGASSVVQLLLGRYRNHRLWPHSPHVPRPSQSALWSACINGDVECVRMLIRDGYFTSIRKDAVHNLCYGCVGPAMKANSFAICQELCEIMGIETHSLRFADLTGVDGSVEALNQRLETDFAWLNVNRGRPDVPTFGQSGLKRAAELLRVENVRFLLERGFRLHDTCHSRPPRIEWRRRRANEQKYHEVQQLLHSYEQPQLEVEL